MYLWKTKQGSFLPCFINVIAILFIRQNTSRLCVGDEWRGIKLFRSLSVTERGNTSWPSLRGSLSCLFHLQPKHQNLRSQKDR